MTDKRNHLRGRDVRPFVVPVGLVFCWGIFLWLSPNTSEVLAPPQAVFMSLFAGLTDGTLLKATVQTMLASLGGLAIGATIGLALGILFGLSAFIDRLLEVVVETVRPIPSVAVLPLVMLVFGFGYRMEIVVVAFATIWPVMIMSRSAVRDLEPRLLDVAKVLGMDVVATVRQIVLPAIAPRILVAVRIAAGVALIVSITTEIAVNPIGLGAAIMEAQQTFQPARMLAILIWIGFIGYGWNAILLAMQKRIVPYQSADAEHARA